VVGAKATKPVMAHRFLNYLLDPKVAYENFTGYVGYQPPITAIDAQKLFDDGLLPRNLANTVVTHEDYANGNAYLTLSSKGRQLWDDSWTAFRNG
jgi:spermidine/putrescine-binding protein